jgi:hypothetical protein
MICVKHGTMKRTVRSYKLQRDVAICDECFREHASLAHARQPESKTSERKKRRARERAERAASLSCDFDRPLHVPTLPPPPELPRLDPEPGCTCAWCEHLRCAAGPRAERDARIDWGSFARFVVLLFALACAIAAMAEC